MIDQPISQFMNRDVLQGEPDLPLPEVIAQMSALTQSAFIVCDDARPLGVITERDAVDVLDHAFRGKAMDGLRARDVMACPAHTLTETATMGEVMRIMKERRFRRVPITDDAGRLTGIVNLTELQAAMNQALERRGRDLEVAVMARTAELQAANERLQELSMSDGLTGLLNRRAMTKKLEESHDVARRYGNAYSVVMIDIDHFKLYNDTLGHIAGDDAIKQIAALLNSAARVSDAVYRYGGEEFVAVVPETVDESVGTLAERIRARTEDLGLPHPASPTSDVVTVSIGYVSVTRHNIVEFPTWREVVQAADEALYRAKEGGRNRVCGPVERD